MPHPHPRPITTRTTANNSTRNDEPASHVTTLPPTTDDVLRSEPVSSKSLEKIGSTNRRIERKLRRLELLSRTTPRSNAVAASVNNQSLSLASDNLQELPLPVGKINSGSNDDLRMPGASANAPSIDLDPATARNWRSLISVDNAQLPSIQGVSAAFKRLEDFIFGSIALILLFPLMALISVVVKLDSTGPALFCQARSGRNREIIKVYKFRTMYQSGSQAFVQAEKDDPRVTRVGGFLRRTSLDELPQLFNVIQGSMSMVGPRPHPLKLDDDFKYVIPALYTRYSVKPGITGWAQINGFRGETRRVSDMVSRIEHDRYYISHWTLWLDIRILVMTVFKGWTHKNAY